MITSINEVVKEVRSRLARKVSQKALSIADASCKREQKSALADGIDGVSEFLNASRERVVSDDQLRDMGLVVSEDQARLWYGICNRLGGLCVSPFDGMPLDAHAAARFRIECDLEALKSERPERRDNRRRQISARVESLRCAVDRVESVGEGFDLPEGFAEMYVECIEAEIAHLKQATHKPSIELDADILLLEAELANT